MTDLINHPPHYASHPYLPGECIDYTRHMGFVRGNAFKYLWRSGAKDDTVQDLEKALWYLNQLKAGDCADPLGYTPESITVLPVSEDTKGAATIACIHLLDSSPIGITAAIHYTTTALELTREDDYDD